MSCDLLVDDWANPLGKNSCRADSFFEDNSIKFRIYMCRPEFNWQLHFRVNARCPSIFYSMPIDP
jgi:hypothetical protein